MCVKNTHRAPEANSGSAQSPLEAGHRVPQWQKHVQRHSALLVTEGLQAQSLPATTKHPLPQLKVVMPAACLLHPLWVGMRTAQPSRKLVASLMARHSWNSAQRLCSWTLFPGSGAACPHGS